jgi:hypothetical protein
MSAPRPFALENNIAATFAPLASAQAHTKTTATAAPTMTGPAKTFAVLRVEGFKRNIRISSFRSRRRGSGPHL